MAHAFAFFADSYETEILKTLSVWAEFTDQDLERRVEPRARTLHEQMVHQCVSEELWMHGMLGLDTGLPPLPAEERCASFIRHYAAAAQARAAQLKARPEPWFLEDTRFFDETRCRAWVLLRRLTHTAHHRGQLTLLARVLGKALHSTYGPTADTGGLFQHRAPVVYRHPTLDALLEGAPPAPLPGPGPHPPTERP
ncbi:MAG TPA: DinB family protein [Holophagaceae bacterium]|nr:DinB family protein [Holophagaceae bacterium]